MGTSKSYGGPGDGIPLLPAWAQGQDSQPAEAGDGGTAPSGDDPEQPPDGSPSPASETPAAASSPAPDPATTAPTSAPWRSAKAQLTRAVRGGGERAHLRSAGRSYVRAQGGASRAAKSSTAGRHAAASLGGFLSDIASRGFAEAARSLGLAADVGRNADAVLASLVNAIAPEGATLEQAVARASSIETLAALYEKYSLESGDFSKLDEMGADDIREAIVDYVSTYVYNRWLEELGLMVEKHAVTPARAVKLEREMRSYIRDTIKLDLKGTDPLSMDWKGGPGRAFVQQAFEDAYGILGGSQ